MPHMQIKHRLTDAVLFEGDFDNIRLCVEDSVRNGVRLDGARIDGARLYGARLDGARLDGARLGGARLDGARLDGARLVGARLDGASLVGASLVGARLDGASLDGASLVGARLVGAQINGLTLRGILRRATRADGYEFVLLDTDAGWRVKAGCRFFSMDEAWRHWETTRGGTPLGEESLDILTMFDLYIERAAKEAA